MMGICFQNDSTYNSNVGNFFIQEDGMAKVDDLVREFLSQKRIAVVGVSDKRETGCNLSYRKFKQNGYQVYAVNPRIQTYDGDVCYPDLRSIPDPLDAVFILTNPAVTEQMVAQCVDLGIKHVWMHCMMGIKPGMAAGLTSVSQNAVETCRVNGIAVIPGSCPNQFLQPDFGHKMMHGLWKLLGYMSLN
jgi:predicted CoA-binding protein